MLCYKNGGLAREHIRDQLNASGDKSWDKFNEAAVNTAPLAQKSDSEDLRLGLYFPRPEIVPNLRAGDWRYAYDKESKQLRSLPATFQTADARNIIESQFLSLRLRSHNLVDEGSVAESGEDLPPQPRRVYLVGGGSVNPAIAKICGEVLGSVEGIYRLEIGGNACGLGAAYKAVWGSERREGETFEELIGARWDEKQFVTRVADGYTKGLFEKYGDAVTGFAKMEEEVLRQETQS